MTQPCLVEQPDSDSDQIGCSNALSRDYYPLFWDYHILFTFFTFFFTLFFCLHLNYHIFYYPFGSIFLKLFLSSSVQAQFQACYKMLAHSFVSDQWSQQFSMLSGMEKNPNNAMKRENKIDQRLGGWKGHASGVRSEGHRLQRKQWHRHVSCPGKGTGTLTEPTKGKKATNQRKP